MTRALVTIEKLGRETGLFDTWIRTDSQLITKQPVVAAVSAVADVRAAIGFSSFAVLLYYAIANASAWTLSTSPVRRFTPAVGLAGCLLLVVTLPHGAAIAGLAVVLLGAAVFAVQRLR